MDKPSQKGAAYLAWEAAQEVQKHMGIASTERLRLIPPDFRYFHVSPECDYVAIYINGENTRSETIDVSFNFDTESAFIYVPGWRSLIRADRIMDFDPYIIDPAEIDDDGSIRKTVSLIDALEKIPIWEAMPVPPNNGSPNIPPRVVGMMR